MKTVTMRARAESEAKKGCGMGRDPVREIQPPNPTPTPPPPGLGKQRRGLGGVEQKRAGVGKKAGTRGLVGVGVGLEVERTQPEALTTILCAQVPPTRLGVAGRGMGWLARTVTAATCSFRAPGRPWSCPR